MQAPSYMGATTAAGRTMPEERTSRIFAGLRLVSTTTRRWSIFSMGTKFTRPDTICVAQAPPP